MHNNDNHHIYSFILYIVQGAAYLYGLVGATYTQMQRLNTGAALALYATSVAMSGSMIIVNAYGESKYLLFHNMLLFLYLSYIFLQDEPLKTIPHSHSSKLIHTHFFIINFSYFTGSNIGAVYLYGLTTSSSTTYTQLQKLYTGIGSGQFGYAVAVTGTTIVVGTQYSEGEY